MWFKNLFGFDEISPEFVRNNILVEGTNIISKVNGKSFQFGFLEIPTLSELREKASSVEPTIGRLMLREIVADVQKLHADPTNENALFQAASQFNLLEMISPQVTPEKGIAIYERDYTQGPACAIACGAGTLYRNYFVPVKNRLGQSADNQIDCLELISEAFDNQTLNLWEMRNGYALFNLNGLLYLNSQLSKLTHTERDELKGKLKIGIQWNTLVTLHEAKYTVSQAYCSALPVAYSQIESIYWEAFARVILEATYEATLCAAVLNFAKTGCNKVFLTLVGGGAFGNEQDWIFDSLLKTLQQFKNVPLDIAIVSYGKSNKEVKDFVQQWNL